MPATLLKKILWHRCFPTNFVKFLRTPFLQNTSGRLLLYLTKLTMNVRGVVLGVTLVGMVIEHIFKPKNRIEILKYFKF